MSTDLSNLYISQSYQRIVQIDPTDGVSLLNGTGSYIREAKIVGDLTVTGSIRAKEYILSSSIVNKQTLNVSGSTDFGDSMDDTHRVTGSMLVTGSLSINGVPVSTGDLGLWYNGTTYISSSKDVQITGSFNVSGSSMQLYSERGGTIFHVQSSGSGDAVIKIEADTDNGPGESDNPRIEFVQDGQKTGSAVYQGNNKLTLANSFISEGGIELSTGTSNGYTNATRRMFITPTGDIQLTGSLLVATHSSDSTFNIDTRKTGKLTQGYYSGQGVSSEVAHANKWQTVGYFNYSRYTAQAGRFLVQLYGDSDGDAKMAELDWTFKNQSGSARYFQSVINNYGREALPSSSFAVHQSGSYDAGKITFYVYIDESYTTPYYTSLGNTDFFFSSSIVGSSLPTGGATGSFTSKLINNGITIDSNNNGYLGVNNTAPSYQLDVDGDTRIVGDAVITGSLTISGSLHAFTLDSDNVVIGSGSGIVMQAGANNNVLLGTHAGQALTTGDNNVFLGHLAGALIDGELDNICIGYDAGGNTAAGNYRINIGHRAGRQNTSDSSIYMGYFAGYQGDGDNSVGIGRESLYRSTGKHNIAIGYQALGRTAASTFSETIAIGQKAGSNDSGGTGNILIGMNVQKSSAAASGELRIGSGSVHPISASLTTGYLHDVKADGLNINGDALITGSLNISGSLMHLYSEQGDTLFHIQASGSGDAVLKIEADTDNGPGESDNPRIEFVQDGEKTGSAIYQSNNYLSIANSFVSAAGIELSTGTSNGYTSATRRMFITSGGTVQITGSLEMTKGSSSTNVIGTTSGATSLTLRSGNTSNVFLDFEEGTNNRYVIGVHASTDDFRICNNASSPNASPAISVALSSGDTTIHNNLLHSGSVTHAVSTVASYATGDSPVTLNGTQRLVKLDSSGGTITVNVPDSATYPGMQIFFKVTNGGNTVTLQRQGSDQIDGANTNTTLDATDESLSIISDGAGNWYIF